MCCSVRTGAHGSCGSRPVVTVAVASAVVASVAVASAVVASVAAVAATPAVIVAEAAVVDSRVFIVVSSHDLAVLPAPLRTPEHLRQGAADPNAQPSRRGKAVART